MINNHYSDEAEQSVLGGMMIETRIDRLTKIMYMLTPESFYQPRNGLIYGAIVSLINSGVNPDLLTVSDTLSKQGSENAAGGFSYLGEIASNTPSVANLGQYAYIVKSHYQKRRLINVASGCLEVATTKTDRSIKEQIDAMYAAIESFASDSHIEKANEMVSMKVITSNVIDDLERRPTEGMQGLTTGIENLDKVLAPKGMVKGGLYVVGARPKIGKTSFLTRIIEHVGVDLKKTCAFFSMEMTNNEVGEKFIGQSARLSTSVLYKEQGMNESEWAMCAEAIKRVATDKIQVSDRPAQSLRDVVNLARKTKRKAGEIGLVAVDYLTLMEAEKADRNDLAFGAITKGLKNLAKELDCPVVLLTQLNRKLEDRPDKRPKPSDSRDTGQIEQDCDAWIGLYRDEVYNQDTAHKGFIELGVELNRHGSTGVAVARFTNGRIENLMASDNYEPQEPMSKTTEKAF